MTSSGIPPEARGKMLRPVSAPKPLPPRATSAPPGPRGVDERRVSAVTLNTQHPKHLKPETHRVTNMSSWYLSPKPPHIHETPTPQPHAYGTLNPQDHTLNPRRTRKSESENRNSEQETRNPKRTRKPNPASREQGRRPASPTPKLPSPSSVPVKLGAPLLVLEQGAPVQSKSM